MTPTEFFKNIADDIRLKSLMLILEEGELCVCELMAALDEPSQPKISRHLALLKSAKILNTRKQKQWVFYSINPELVSWAKQVLMLTQQDNLDFIKTNQQKLADMGDRPERIQQCCP